MFPIQNINLKKLFWGKERTLTSPPPLQKVNFANILIFVLGASIGAPFMTFPWAPTTLKTALVVMVFLTKQTDQNLQCWKKAIYLQWSVYIIITYLITF
jgi:hypothetical protein